MFDDTLVTVWSAPNYCYRWVDWTCDADARCGNLASIMKVNSSGNTSFKIFEAAIENMTDQKNPALRRLVRRQSLWALRH